MERMREDKTYEKGDATDKSVADISFSYCKFVGCKFKETVFDGVTFNECKFEDCSFVNPVFKDTSIKFCTFVSCSLIGLNWTAVSSAYAAVIEKADGCLFKFNNFEDMNLKKTDFGKSQIVSSAFYKVNAPECNFSECVLEDTLFSMCDLRKSDFRSARGFNMDIATCKLKDARFSYSNLVGLVGGLGIKIE